MKMKIPRRNRMSASGSLLFLAVFVSAMLVIPISSMAASKDDQQLTRTNDLPPPDVPQPQFFCGYCHVLTYPEIIKKGHDLWEKGKHSNYACVDCHYPPKSETALSTTDQPPFPKKEHISRKSPERFSYVPLGGQTVRTRPRVLDANCTTSACHGNPKDQFKTKKIKFTEKVAFVHKPHLEAKNQIEGLKLNCTSCHQHESDQKKFEVTQAVCHLCHFTNVKFNEGRGRCELCHQLPQKPIQTSGEKPITHEILKEAGVSCYSCHIELIQAVGGGKFEAFFEAGELKTSLVLGAGRMKPESCLTCHDQDKALKERQNKKLMHEKHVTVKNARCFDCHRPIRHTKADLQQPMDKQTTRVSCEACHFESHTYQRILSAGPKREGVSKTPDFMFKARTNCLGCHNEQKLTQKGAKVMSASGKTCVRCHTKEHDKMLEDWKIEVADNVKEAQEVEQEAMAVLAENKAKLTESQLAEANAMLKNGRADLDIVQFGNGVHNKKYSIMLIDAAITRFEDMIDYLEEVE